MHQPMCYQHPWEQNIKTMLREISLQHLKTLLDSPWTMYWIYRWVSSAPCEHWTCLKQHACECFFFCIIEAWQGAVSGKHSGFIRSSSQVSPIGCMFCAHGNIVCKQLCATFICIYMWVYFTYNIKVIFLFISFKQELVTCAYWSAEEVPAKLSHSCYLNVHKTQG